MITELNKYKAEVLKIAGFAFLTPIAKLVLDLTALFKKFGFIGFVIYFILCLALGTLGIIFILRGCDILDINARK